MINLVHYNILGFLNYTDTYFLRWRRAKRMHVQPILMASKWPSLRCSTMFILVQRETPHWKTLSNPPEGSRMSILVGNFVLSIWNGVTPSELSYHSYHIYYITTYRIKKKLLETSGAMSTASWPRFSYLKDGFDKEDLTEGILRSKLSVMVCTSSHNNLILTPS